MICFGTPPPPLPLAPTAIPSSVLKAAETAAAAAAAAGSSQWSKRIRGEGRRKGCFLLVLFILLHTAAVT